MRVRALSGSLASPAPLGEAGPATEDGGCEALQKAGSQVGVLGSPLLRLRAGRCRRAWSARRQLRHADGAEPPGDEPGLAEPRGDAPLAPRGGDLL